MPDARLDGGSDLCTCGSGEPWPCPATQAAWLARGIEPDTEAARIRAEAHAALADRLTREHAAVLHVDRVEPVNHQVVLLCRHPATLTVAVADVPGVHHPLPARLLQRPFRPARRVHPGEPQPDRPALHAARRRPVDSAHRWCPS